MRFVVAVPGGSEPLGIFSTTAFGICRKWKRRCYQKVNVNKLNAGQYRHVRQQKSLYLREYDC